MNIFSPRALAGRTYNPENHFIAHRVEQNLLRQISTLQGPLGRILILHPITDLLPQAFPGAQVFQGVNRSELPFKAHSFDLILDVMSWHWINDLPTALLEIQKILTPQGVYLAGFLGGQTLTQLRQAFLAADIHFFQGAAQRIAPMAQAQTLSDLLLACGFQDPVLDCQSLTVHYKSLKNLLTDLKDMGERGYLVRGTLKQQLSKTYYHFLEDFCFKNFPASKGYMEITYDLIYATARPPL